MRKLIRGFQEFQSNYFEEKRDLFEQLAHGQHPRVLFITCSDSRIAPNIMLNTDPGELFVIRNAGNLMPPFGAANGGEGASLEYAIHALNIDQIIVCGHNHCGAMKGLLKLNQLQEEMPLVYDWLKHAEATRRLLKENYSQYEGEELLDIAVAENVLTQIENLKTYPVVRSRLHQGKLHIYGWIYEIESGEILAYDPDMNEFKAPQSMLYPEDKPQLEVRPGKFVHTSAPPVSEADQRHAVAAKPAPSNGQSQPVNRNSQSADYLSAPWVMPEQAERIYRGSANQR
ncbi:carbonic anhydrase [Alkalinema sp. FACHB-956]|uniref:carbonic anhydrase n=1 Tax=Alkalinema sp. FACHB-956 TaxID=2692768 RepID=UPI0016842709|nr:carbonic anhydrase [Alkalinema sp. FACHB-956]MBD2330164.1 carbonic anhydrase [Alkalinema sp. FACHB-956]